MIKEMRDRIEEIKKRLEEYEKHKDEPYAYYHGEIKAVRELKHHAPADIDFLLKVIAEMIEEYKLNK